MNTFLTAQELRRAMTPVTYMAVFDDANSKDLEAVDGSAEVVQVLRLSWVQVASFLRTPYGSQTPATESSASWLLKAAQLHFALVYAYRRHPEYVKTYGAEPNGKLWNEAIEFMGRIQAATQQIPTADSPPQGDPDNVGVVTYDDSPKIAVPSDPYSQYKNTALGDW